MRYISMIFFVAYTVLSAGMDAMAIQPSPAPDQIHLTWTGDPATTVTIQWRTDLSVTESTVNYGTTTAYTMSTIGTSFNVYGVTATNTSYVQVVQHHVVELQGLSPLTTYHYQVGGAGQFSPDYYFTTGPSTGSTNPTFNFIVCGDSRGSSLGSYGGINPSLSTFAQTLFEQHPAFIIFSGDAVSTGKIDEWDDWFSAMSAVSPYVVIMPVDGNHEEYSPDFYSQFALPLANGRTTKDLSAEKGVYYSFNYGNAHFTILDDQSLYGVPVQTDELTWLKNDLQSTHTVWRFVANHEPEFSAGGRHGSNTLLQQYWVPVFMNNHVDMVFNGHNHFYERTYPLDEMGNPVPQGSGVIYIIAGSIGAPLYDPSQASFVAYEEKTYNYAIIHVAGNTISMDAYRLSDVPSNNYNTIMDSIPAYTKVATSSTGSNSSGCSCSINNNSASSMDGVMAFTILGIGLIVLKGLFKNCRSS
ncbi:MAG: purple acid phosphatase family protein [bacterium]